MFFVTTEHFDIIFPEESKQTALRIASACEELYTKACTLLETKTYFRIPVAITPDTDLLNAYYSPEPYHRIVIYDTVPNAGMMTSYDETIISVFYHELVHAISLGIRSPSWEKASKIIGDILGPSQIFYLPIFFYEGVTVSFESLDGAGRLNDEYSLHVLRQAKVAGEFPDWRVISGARDIYPTGTPSYIFGGAFSAYLQSHYGMSKYAEYWHECGRINFFKFMGGVFEKVFGLSLDDAWKDFYESIEVPKNVYNVVNLDSDNLVFEKENNIFYAASASDNCVVWMDNISKSVKMLSLAQLNKSENTKRKTQKLFSADSGASRLAFSLDGKILAYSYALIDDSAKNTVKLFDMSEHKFVETLTGIRDACPVVLSSGKNAIVGVKTFSQDVSLVFTNYDGSELFQKKFPLDVIPINPIYCDNGFVAYLLKNHLDWSIELFNPETSECYNYPLDIIPFNLAASPSGITFSWYDKNDTKIHLARSAILEILFSSSKETAKPVLSISKQMDDFSGGVFYPLLVRKFNLDSNLFWVAKFFENDFLLKKELKEIKFSDFCELNLNHKSIGESSKSDNVVSESDFDIENYNKWEHLHKGIFVPLVLSSLNTSSFTADIFSLGVSYLTSDPTRELIIQNELMYNFFDKSIGVNIFFTNKPKDWQLTTYLGGNYSFDLGWYAQGYFNAYRDIPIGNNYKVFTFKNYLQWTSSDCVYSYENPVALNFHKIQEVLTFGLSNFRKVDTSIYAIKGLSFDVNINAICTFDFDFLEVPNFYAYPNIVLGARLPRLLPFRNPVNFTLNLPAQFSLSVLPYETTSEPDDEDMFLSGYAKVVLFSREIQRTLWKSSIYLNRITFNGRYNFNLTPEGGTINYYNLLPLSEDVFPIHYNHSVALETRLYFNLIFGCLTGSIFEIGFDAKYDITKSDWEFDFAGGLKLSI